MQPEITHVISASTAISIWYRQRKMLAEEIFPRVPGPDLEGKYFRFSKQGFRTQVVTGAPGSFPRSFTLDLNSFGYFKCQPNTLSIELPDMVRNHADDPAALDLIHQDSLLGIMNLVKEQEAISLISTANLPQNATLSGTTQWSDYTNSDPITEIRKQARTIQQAIGVDKAQMRLLVTALCFDTLVRHPAVREDIKYVTNLLDSPVDENNLAKACGIEKVLVAENLQLSNNEGQPDSLGYTWPNAALLFYHTGAAARLTPNFGYTFISQPDTYPIKRFRIEGIDSDFFKSQEVRQLVLTEPNAGFLWNTPI